MNAFTPYLLLIAFMVCPLAALLFVVRLVVALFSTKVLKQMRQYPVIHVIWGCFAFVGVLVFWGFNPAMWPPLSLERSFQRQQVLKRIQPVGGWAALKRDCDALVSKYKDDDFGFRWGRDDTNSMPPTIAALTPRMVEFLSPKAMQKFGGEFIGKSYGTNLVVRIYIFGGHATGGHDQPTLGLDVLCESGVTNYNPVRLLAWAPLEHWKYRKIVDDVYEFYY
jgi:hypothetical protein